MLKYLPLVSLIYTELFQVDGLQHFNFRQDTVVSNRCELNFVQNQLNVTTLSMTHQMAKGPSTVTHLDICLLRYRQSNADRLSLINQLRILYISLGSYYVITYFYKYVRYYSFFLNGMHYLVTYDSATISQPIVVCNSNKLSLTNEIFIVNISNNY